MFPVIPLLVWRKCQDDKQVPGREMLIRYAIYTLMQALITAVVTVFMCDEGTSFLVKADASPRFALKFAVLKLAVAALVSLAEWMYSTRRLVITVAWQEYREMGIVRFIRKYIFPCGLYLVAVLVVLLNVSLMFDNVLWGDECFSANTAQKDVTGILQVMYFWDNHPPLHYYWLKMFGELFGHTGTVYHLASLTPFFIGVIMALVLFRKHFGNIPTAFFIIITGMASSCMEYNLEIRMYSLAFLGVTGCYYCAYRVLSGGKLAWFGMVFWALVGAYSHYYAMMAAGIIIFVTGVAAVVRYKGKTWVKAVLSLIGYIVGYSPWFKYLFHGTDSVHNDWWVTEITSLKECVQMLSCGMEFEKIVLILLVVCLAGLFLTESSFFRIHKKGNVIELAIHRPVLKNWSDEAYGAAVGALSLVGIMVAARVVCWIVGPVLVQRYLYPVSAITVLLLVISGSRCLTLIKALGEKLHKEWLEKLAKCVLVAALTVLAVIGLGNYKVYSSQVKAEKMATEQTFSIMGDVPEDAVLITNHVKHLGWTVLYYYFDNEIITGSCRGEGAEYDKFWYFTPEPVAANDLKKMQEAGYTVTNYGAQQIAVYSFELYYFEKD